MRRICLLCQCSALRSLFRAELRRLPHSLQSAHSAPQWQRAAHTRASTWYHRKETKRKKEKKERGVERRGGKTQVTNRGPKGAKWRPSPFSFLLKQNIVSLSTTRLSPPCLALPSALPPISRILSRLFRVFCSFGARYSEDSVRLVHMANGIRGSVSPGRRKKKRRKPVTTFLSKSSSLSAPQ